jgi:hypothetical protein
MDLINGTIVYAEDFPDSSFNIKVVNVDIAVHSVENGQIESSQPFSLCGNDGNGIFFACSELIPGHQDITVTVTQFICSLQHLPVASCSYSSDYYPLHTKQSIPADLRSN